MTVYELISLNQMITDVEITVRKDGKLLDQLNIGCAEGVKPPYPMMVPIDERYIDNIGTSHHREATYIPKSINAWDDGKDYWQIKTNRIPQAWLDLEVYSWNVWQASRVGTTSARRGNNVNFHGERININVLPSGQKLEIAEKPKSDHDDDQIDGQLSFDDMEVWT